MQTDYFIIGRAGPATYPLLAWDQSSSLFSKRKPVTVTEPVRLRLGAPVPPNPIMVDHHSLPRPVVSERLVKVLEPLDLDGVQLVPATVQVKGAALRYWLLHVFNEVACLDKQRAEFSLSPNGWVGDIERLVLDEKVLRDIPLEKRLVFVLAESTSMHLFHASVMEKVMAIKPEGLRFCRVDQWNDASAFLG